MWLHAATQRNIATLRGDGVTVMAPDEGEMACGEYGPGRLPEPEALKQAIDEALAHAHASVPLTGPPDFAPSRPRPLYSRRILVTPGPTHEPIDPENGNDPGRERACQYGYNSVVRVDI